MFQKLPLELRLMIWRFAIPRYRKIWLHARRQRGKTSYFNLPVLPLAHTCRESRLDIHRYLGMDPNIEDSFPICITELDVVRLHFKLAFRHDRSQDALYHLIVTRRPGLVSLVQEMEIVVDRFSNLDVAMLYISRDDIFPRFERLKKLTLLVPKAAEWIERCSTHFLRGSSVASPKKTWTNEIELVILEAAN
ncbi:hypothetical protein QTJ16_001839 [Diplocarpon rosae]|uniref:2EXR domain-containing protein n=1 Tax=Diplocarpon rosae TaxID=946125 RepID=A0AAD9T3V6_9HELO|nr:hypothetical protein QTJ16_001839 [Diplocarpon rosae]